jgi:hypothetical protein
MNGRAQRQSGTMRSGPRDGKTDSTSWLSGPGIHEGSRVQARQMALYRADTGCWHGNGTETDAQFSPSVILWLRQLMCGLE